MQHTNHSADKRKKSARKAADAYRKEYNKLIPLLQQEKMEEAEAEENALNEMKRKKEEYLKKSKLFCPLIQLRIDTVLF